MTLQQIAERRPRKIDLNLLPPEYRPVKKSKLSLILVLVAVILVCASVSLIILKFGVDSDIKPMREQITSLDATIDANAANNQAASAIQTMINDNISKMAVMQANYSTAVNSRILWSQLIAEINELTPYSKIAVTSIAPAGTCIAPAGICPSGSEPVITLIGISLKQQYILDYATILEESPFFKNVVFSFQDNGIGIVNFTITVPLDMQNVSTNVSK
jgi:Tfp pilus assembly protein PilN